MPAVVNLHGTLLAPAAARLSIFDRGFLAGDQVYEVIRTYRLELFAVAEHLARLAHSAARIGLPIPWDDARLASELRRTVEASRGGDGPEPPGLEAAPWNAGQRSVRLVVTRGVGEEDVALGLEPGPRVILAALPLRGPPASAYREGVRCRLAPPRVPRADPGSKTGGHLAEALAAREARAAGANETLFLDAGGRVTEGASSNLFRVVEGRLETPPLAAGVLPGVTRGLVLGLAARAGIAISERALAAADLAGSDEVFLTSTGREILPVTRLDDVPIGGGRPGPVTAQLHGLFRAAADSPVSR